MVGPEQEETAHGPTAVLTFTLEPEIDQIPAARRFVVDAVNELGGRSDGVSTGDVALAASEAITNAVVHGGTRVDVAVERVGDDVRVSVHDADPAEIPAAPEAGE